MRVEERQHYCSFTPDRVLINNCNVAKALQVVLKDCTSVKMI